MWHVYARHSVAVAVPDCMSMVPNGPHKHSERGVPVMAEAIRTVGLAVPDFMPRFPRVFATFFDGDALALVELALRSLADVIPLSRESELIGSVKMLTIDQLIILQVLLKAYYIQ